MVELRGKGEMLGGGWGKPGFGSKLDQGEACLPSTCTELCPESQGLRALQLMSKGFEGRNHCQSERGPTPGRPAQRGRERHGGCIRELRLTLKLKQSLWPQVLG